MGRGDVLGAERAPGEQLPSSLEAVAAPQLRRSLQRVDDPQRPIAGDACEDDRVLPKFTSIRLPCGDTHRPYGPSDRPIHAITARPCSRRAYRRCGVAPVRSSRSRPNRRAVAATGPG